MLGKLGLDSVLIPLSILMTCQPSSSTRTLSMTQEHLGIKRNLEGPGIAGSSANAGKTFGRSISGKKRDSMVPFGFIECSRFMLYS